MRAASPLVPTPLDYPKILSVGRSADTARKSACATRIHDHPIGHGRRFVAPETFPPGIVCHSPQTSLQVSVNIGG